MIKINNRIIKPEYFPDGTMKLNITFFDDFIKIEWYYDSENELLQLVYIVNHIHDISPDIKIYLIMPYIPNARFDRTVEVDEVFTLKYFVDIINSLNFDSVEVLDPHSHVSEALLIDYLFKFLTFTLKKCLINYRMILCCFSRMRVALKDIPIFLNTVDHMRSELKEEIGLREKLKVSMLQVT